MRKKLRIKKSAANAYSALSGERAIQLSGSSDCLVAEYLTHTITHQGIRHKLPISKYAYHLYTKTPINKIKKVTQSCGVDQCVNESHLVADLHPEKTWGDN